MKFPANPSNEKERLQDLYSYYCLDSDPEVEFDQLTKLASAILKVPIAMICLIDNERQWFKAKHGIDLTETSREASICAHAILQDELFEVEDTLLDFRFYDNPLLVLGGLRYYAGIPLVSSSNQKLGTFGIVDTKPKKLSPEEREILKIFADQASHLLELRKKKIELQCEELETLGLTLRRPA